MSTTDPISKVQTELNKKLTLQKNAFIAEGEVEYKTRVDRIDRAIELLVTHCDGIEKAVCEDFGSRSRHITLMAEVSGSINSLKFVKKHLKKWMKPEKRSPGIPMNVFGAKACVKYQPKGVVGVMAPWNFPVNMVFSPLADILGAGNRAMIKPSEHTPATSELLEKAFKEYFEETEITVCTGGPETGIAFSKLPFDHLIFTGGTEIGRQVMKCAAENLTPVTLELGGKSPVIIGDSADISDAAEKIMTGKMFNSGQACISPDYVFVPATRLELFLSACRKALSKQYPKAEGNLDFTSLIAPRHVERLQSYVDEALAANKRVEQINPAQEDLSTQAHNRLLPHFIVNPDDDSLVMQHELFGTLMAVRSYQKLDEAIDFINARPRPLALYYFGKDRSEEKEVIDRTRSGGMAINDVMMHVSCDDLPFGGIGDSGIGNYRGRDGFRTFSHPRAVFRQGFVSAQKLFGMLPPYTEKAEKMTRGMIKK